MYLSITISAFNGADSIAEQLEALANQVSPGPFEVIVSDNGSTDATREIVELYMGKVPGLRLIDSSDRRGRSYARNAGAAAAAAEALALTPEGKLVDDFLLVRQRNALHVCNAPSPAATASLEIAAEICRQIPLAHAKSPVSVTAGVKI